MWVEEKSNPRPGYHRPEPGAPTRNPPRATKPSSKEPVFFYCGLQVQPAPEAGPTTTGRSAWPRARFACDGGPCKAGFSGGEGTVRRQLSASDGWIEIMEQIWKIQRRRREFQRSRLVARPAKAGTGAE